MGRQAISKYGFMVAVSLEDVVQTAGSDRFAARYVCTSCNLVAGSLPAFTEWQSSVWYVQAVVGHLSRRDVVSMSAQGAVLTAGVQWLASSELLCLAWVYG